MADTSFVLKSAFETTLEAGNLWINGQQILGGGTPVEVYDPRTGEALLSLPDASEAQVHDAVQSAKRAFEDWSITTPKTRSEALLALANTIEGNAETFAALEALNCGKPKHLVLADEIPAIVDTFRYFAGAVRNQSGPVAADYLEGSTSFIRLAPIGVVGSIAPWNYPLMMAAWKIAPALAAGCTIVLKPAEVTPLTTILLATLTHDILPKGVLNVVTGRGVSVGKSISAHPDVDMVALTGDTATGAAVLEAIAPRVARTHLELGGKSPVIVLDDASIPDVVNALCSASFYNAGQDCTAASTVLATPKAYKALISQLPAAVAELRYNSAIDTANALGPLITAAQQSKVDMLVKDAVSAGALCLCGGKAGPGFYYQPTVLAELPSNAKIAREEAFGPVITIMQVKSPDAAITIANQSNYGLAASVWSQNVSKAMHASARLRFGCTWVNCHSLLVSEMPHGGLRKSGYGKDLSAYALSDYQVAQHIMVQHSSPEISQHAGDQNV